MRTHCLSVFMGLFAAAAVQAAALAADSESNAAADARASSVARFQRAVDALGLESSPILVGFATSMEKILPRDVPFELAVAKDVDVHVARNEKESFQVAVMPRKEALKKVSVTVGDLASDSGGVFPADNVDCDVVGYVETKRRPPYKVSHVGWWPDPILDFLGPVDVAPGDAQTFWIRLRAAKDQAPGVYRGTIRVSAEGVEPLSFGLSVRVHAFTLPDHTPLPTAITFFERTAQMGGEANWPEMKLQYADFLADYYIDYDSLYRGGSPDYEIVRRLHDQGRLVAFNLGNVFNAGTKAEGFEQAIAQTVERIRPAYEEAKQLGLLDHAYIYGFDERPKEQFGLLEQSAQALRKAFPEVLLMTTSYDHSFGLESEVKTMDAWCPLTPRFDPQKAARARAQGKKVWWYICCGPRNPHANWFVEYAAIEARLLMGAMTAKYRPDGFLYYSLSIWNDNRPIQSGPFTDWNPVSWTTYHGDGSLLCSGPGGKPVPTIRLENYRDGQEDYAYAVILEAIVRRVEAKGGSLSAEQQQWLREAKAALAVPESLVETMSQYSHDPQALYAYRNRLADLIDRSGMPDADPWGKDFGVRGFATR
ncbi:MAG TPA: glycoside hydrolase domain-containing protein [Thermoguttaceae bacterium]|nr:glycoside hydrolase domain-containing protein [Thermoguttaceae bacterium]